MKIKGEGRKEEKKESDETRSERKRRKLKEWERKVKQLGGRTTRIHIYNVTLLSHANLFREIMITR